MKKILFLIHDLGQGGAEKVLVNLVNHMDRSKFDISLTVLFGGGVNEQFLAPDIHFSAVFPRMIPGNSKLMKLMTPRQLHRLCVKERYDIEVSYLEGPSARVISGCGDKDTRLVCWIHSTFSNMREAAASFRSDEEARKCYSRFDMIACVSRQVQQSFTDFFPDGAPTRVIYNTIDSDFIRQEARKTVAEDLFPDGEIALISVGSLKPVKAFDRLIRIHAELRENGYPVHTYLLGKGPDLEKLQDQVEKTGYGDTFTFLGYDSNPYKYMARSDLFVCCSLSEGFSTAVTEAVIVGTPVCTVDVSGMKEILGENNEWGVVTENSEEALYRGVKKLLDDPAMLATYQKKAAERGAYFHAAQTTQRAEIFLRDFGPR